MTNSDCGETLWNLLRESDSLTGWMNTHGPQYCYTSKEDERYKDWVESNVIKKEATMSKVVDYKEENKMISTNMFNDIFGRIEPGMCRISMSGKIAIKTTNGYKAFDSKTGRLTNCDNFAFDIGEDFFFVIPTNKLEPGDIILAGGRPRCVLEVGKNEIKTFCYEDSTISTIVPEHHMFMGQSYFYGKIISMFGEMGKGAGSKGVKQIMKFMMLKEMIGGKNAGNGSMAGMTPLMALMGGFGDGNTFFDGILDFDDTEEEEAESEEPGTTRKKK